MSLTLKQSELLDRMLVRSARRGEIGAMWGTLSAKISELLAMQMTLSAEDEELARENEIDMKRLQELITNGEIAPVSLMFDDAKRMIRWDGGFVQLGGKPYRFVKTLYFAKKRQVQMNQMAQAVWNNPLLPYEKQRDTVSKLKKVLSQANFPYEIRHVKVKQQANQVKNPNTGFVKTVIVQREIEGYKMRVK